MKNKSSITVAVLLVAILTLSVFPACNQRRETMKEPTAPPMQSPDDYHGAGTAAKRATEPDYTRAGTAAAQPPTATESPR